MAYPFIAYVIAVIRAGMVSPRFVLPVCFGFAIAVAVTSYKLFSRSSLATVGILILFVSWVFAREGVVAYSFFNQRVAFFRVRDRIPAAKTTVVSDSLLVLPLHYYSSPEIASRIVFPVDFNAIRRYKKEDSPEQNLWAGRSVFPVPVVPLKLLKSPNYLIVTTGENWLLQKLAREGTPARKLPIETDSKDITGFFPLCHGEAFYFDKGKNFTMPLYATNAESTEQ
jgi:hypothetical protein